MGPSGTGKSVLLKNIIGLLRPEARRDLGRRRGDVPDGGEGPLPGPPQVRRPLPGRRPVRLDELFDNIAFPLREHTKKSEKEIKEIVLEKLEMVGMLDH